MKYFKQSEFSCKCCGKNKTSLVLMGMLDEARHLAGVPFIINSGYRCESHNKAVGGVETSSHRKGLAVDIKAVGSRNRYLILNALLKVGFNRIGIANNFIHCDIDGEKDLNVIWNYQK